MNIFSFPWVRAFMLFYSEVTMYVLPVLQLPQLALGMLIAILVSPAVTSR